MYIVFVLLLFSRCFVANTSADIEKHVKTIHGNLDPPLKKIYEFNANDFHGIDGVSRHKRAADTGPTVDPSTKINYLNDTHKQLMVHWVGEKSHVVICLSRDPTPVLPRDPTPVLSAIHPINPSAVYISYNDGDTYQNKTDSFKLPNGSYATLEKFYNHPRYNTHFVFTDIHHNMMYVTTDHGKSFKMIPLKFTPSELSFHELQPSTFVVLDKNDTQNKLWITEDFGESFRLAHEFVSSFYWIKDVNENQILVVQRFEPNGLSTVIYSKNLFKSRISQIYATNAKDFFLKSDYIFTTKKNAKDELELYVSYKLGKQLPCVFNSALDFKSFFIADVTGNRALVVASHSDIQSHLYVSDNLSGNDGSVKFTLSLEDVFAHFPNNTWQGTWLHHISENAFADVYKVQGLSGIYIASRMISKPSRIILGPQHLGSVITFDHGASWRLIKPPADDVEGQSTACLTTNNCSLHLSQEFSRIYPEEGSVGILSSKSAPGVIVATGVLGKNLKGHYGVYVSLDAGLTWRQTLRELYFFNMGDHGGILTAVKYFKTKGETRHILYSLDEGEHWNETVFHNEEIRLYGLMTEPGENTTVFTMFGSLPAEHQWIIVKVDFKNVFKAQCGVNDYKMWSPSRTEENRSYIPCILGEQTTFQRRMTNAQCLNGLDYVRVVSKEACDCDIFDFECDFGFKRIGQPPRCILDKSNASYDPYKIPGGCRPGHFYNRTKGYRKISGDVCVQGFESHYLPDVVPCPIKEVNNFLLFAQRERISRFNLVTETLEELPVKNLKNVIAIDYDIENNCVYWADIALDTIGRQCFTNGSKQEMLVSSDLASIEGMAFDWISKTLYFVDGVRSKIELIRTDINHSGRMRRTILDSKVLRKPRGIALHPQNGYMFWTDWSAENPSINRASLDGSNNLTLFGREKVEWPNGISVDYIANRIYWVDARQDYIGSSDLHGDGFLKVVSDNEVVSHPFAVAVFKSNMYWDDWKRNAIFSADKDSFKGVDVIVKQLLGLMDLKVYAHGIQIGTNACTKASCTHICVGLPKNKYACLCPDGMQMKNNTCLCPGDVAALPNMTCPLVGNSCSSGHFSCGNGVCVPRGWKCDGEDDCGDNSDEAQCGMQTCPPGFHICGDGKCLPHYWKCDYDSDCADGSDELNCPRQNCTTTQFSCENGRCISATWKCDGENDCRDGSDERNCNLDRPLTCKRDEFQCKSGAVTCIPSTWKCDEEPDCRDGSDELNCNNNTCSEMQFACGPPKNRCIYNTWVCDGDKDCADGRDEKNCSTEATPPPTKPYPNPFDGKNVCQDWMFKCKNQRCIPYWWKCDQADDCGDNSDEEGCPVIVKPIVPATTPKPPVIACQNNQFQCHRGDCIEAAWVCDGMFDCMGGEDEQHCNEHTNCSKDQFKCRIDGSCVSLFKVCNGIFDCPDATDEMSCNREHNLPNGPATPSCNVGFFPCDGYTCYPLSVLCDGRIDCKDGYDESNCTKNSRVYQVLQMGVDERKNATSLLLFWGINMPNNAKLEFMPSIAKVGEDKWQNQSWTEETDYEFTGLQPFTKYNMTVFVRMQNTTTVFPPAKYLINSTDEDVPSAPWNTTATQRNGSHVLVSWNKPLHPNGIIVNYQIIWAPPNSPEIRLKLSGNETSHLLSADFQHETTYTFYVTAFNRHYESNRSEAANIKFDGETNLHYIKNLKVVGSTNTSISLDWSYDGEADGFVVNITIEKQSYPRLPPYKAKTKNCTLTLAPGVQYQFEVNAIRNGLEGPKSSISASTSGQSLPEVPGLQAMVVKDVGTTVKLSWNRPDKGSKGSSKVNWFYGVYYGVNFEQLMAKPMLRTTNLTATVTNLDACESYLFAVGLVGPYGFGPLSKNVQQVTTSTNPLAPPKNVNVSHEGSNPLRMRVQWLPSCSSLQSDSYVIQTYEKNTKKTSNVKLSDKKLSHTFDVSYGGVYVIRVSTGVAGSIPSKPVTYAAPSLIPPKEIDVIPQANGSYVIYWQESNLPSEAGSYKYEVLVQRGYTLNETTAEKYVVDKPPFVYTNEAAGNSYTFAVRTKTDKGFSSVMSELMSKRVEEPLTAQASTNMTAILVPSILVVVALIAVITFLVVRNRRLRNSFVRFANSHYNTRSGAATFDDHDLEEDDNPRIVGFSDDEPLVIA